MTPSINSLGPGVWILVLIGAVWMIFLSGVPLVWLLRKFAGVPRASLVADYKSSKLRLALSGNGPLGCYLIVVIAEFVALYILIRIFH